MSATFCPRCLQKLKVPDDAIGRNVKCPGCGHTFAINEPPIFDPPALPSAAARVAKQYGRRQAVGMYVAALALVLITAAGTSAATAMLLREPLPQAAPQPVSDNRVPDLENRLSEMVQRVNSQQRIIERLEKLAAQTPAPMQSPAPMQTTAPTQSHGPTQSPGPRRGPAPITFNTKTENTKTLRQLSNQADAIRITAAAIDEINERFRIALILQFRNLSQSERADLQAALAGIDNKKLTWEQFKRAGKRLGGVGFGCMLLKDIAGVRDCLARDFDGQGDAMTAKLLRNEKIE
jgi:hypothetical protein